MTRRIPMHFSKQKPAALPAREFGRTRQHGASMIEVLVSILLVSVGLLGIAGLSGATFGYNKVSQLRLTGVALANDLGDRARVNVFGYDRGGYNIALDDDFATDPDTVAVPDANLDLDPNNAANAGTAADGLAASDVDQFLRNVRNRLPQGDAVVVPRPGGNTRELDVWLLWQEPTADAGDALFDAGKENCPSSLSTAQLDLYSCMYFKVGL
jgi:type IV pilus assembly protein PilV